MAADVYIRSAITQLNTALTDLQGQMDGMHRDVGQHKQQLQHEIQQLEQQHKLHGMELTQLQDDSQKKMVQARMAHINKNADEKKAEMARLDAELGNILQRKTQAYNKLHNIAGQLDLLMASPDLH